MGSLTGVQLIGLWLLILDAGFFLLYFLVQTSKTRRRNRRIRKTRRAVRRAANRVRSNRNV